MLDYAASCHALNHYQLYLKSDLRLSEMSNESVKLARIQFELLVVNFVFRTGSKNSPLNQACTLEFSQML